MKTQKLNVTLLNKSRYVIKNSSLAILIVSLFLITFTSCKSDSNQEENNKPDGIALKNRMIENRNGAMQTFNEDACANCPISITGTQGTTVTFPPNSLGLNGSPVTGNVQIELIEIYGKANMVLQDRSTKGKKPNGDEEALNSAGEFYVNAKQNGTQLEILSPVTISSKGINPADWEPMGIFKAGDNLEDEDLWEETDENGDQEPDQAQGGERDGPNGVVMYNSYELGSFGWSNLDRWYNFTGQLTDLFVDVPNGYDDTNCIVYLSYDGENALANMDTWDAGQQMFTEHFGRIPVGQEVHFIMLAEIGGVLHYAIQGTTIVDGHIEVISSLQPTTEAQLNTLLDALP